ncbi:hypothetical protein, partial [Microcoleus sp.]|uniref:hypothetical protein n=1 Tax=Microcoleus sp. TaxID=44472 RepID=UPI00403E6008
TGKMPVPQENSLFVEQASCLFLRMVQDVSTNKHKVARGGFCAHKLALSIDPWRFRSPTKPYRILWFFFAYLLS